MPNWLFILLQMRRRLWLTAALYSVIGVAAALVAAQFGRYVPADFPLKLGSGAVDDILGILASSMLAVATFSLTTLVAAYTSVVGNASSRAARLLVADGGIRNALATFVGAFIYSIVGIVALHTQYYGDQGRVILFFVTLGVLVFVILAMLRWIAQLTDLAQSHAVVERVADAVGKAMATPISRARRLRGEAWSPPETATAVCAEKPGFVQNIDLSALAKIAEEHRLVLYVDATPGSLVHRAQPLLWSEGADTPECLDRLASAVTVGPERTFDQDPLYGLQVLGEIAARALSPGVNDPGTAREVLGRTTLLLSAVAEEDAGSEDEAENPRVRFRPLLWSEFLREAWRPVVVHGAADLQLQLFLQQCLETLRCASRGSVRVAASEFGKFALESALAAHPRASDRRELQDAAHYCHAAPDPPPHPEQRVSRVR
jgi:uncharacterized membrane protein